MAKRVILFAVLSSLVLVGYAGLMWWLGPPPQRPPRPAQADPLAVTDDPDAPPRDPAEAVTDTPAQADPSDPIQPGDDPSRSEQEPAPSVLSEQMVTLGSHDTSSPLKLAATFSTRGASIVRVELNSARYRDLDIHQAWVGSLELVEQSDPTSPGEGAGLRVQAVMAGTPAAKAGVVVGDVIAGVGGTPVLTVRQWQTQIDQIRPRDEVVLQILRGPNRQPIVVPVIAERAPVAIVRPGDAGQTPTDIRLSYMASLVNATDAIEGRAEGVRTVSAIENRNWRLVATGGATDPNSESGPDADATRDPSAYVVRLPAGEGDTPTTAGEQVTFETELSAAEADRMGLTGPVTLRKIFTLREATAGDGGDQANLGLHLTMRLEIVQETTGQAAIAWRIRGPVSLPDEGWWYANKIGPAWFSAVGARDVIWNTVSSGHELLGAPEIAAASTRDRSQETVLFSALAGSTNADARRVRYVGVDAQYFLAAILPGTAPPLGEATFRAWEGRAEAIGAVNVANSVSKKKANTSFVLTTEPAQPEAGVTGEEFTLFFGPKEPDVLSPYGLGEAVYYGWFWWVSVPLLWVLHAFYAVVGNYGLAIVMLTVMVRLCLFPLSRRLAKNAAKMQALAPEMKALKEKHGDDPMKLQKAQSELFKQHKFNPLGGCWMAFVQLPIFMGLYRGLATDIELRGAPLIPGLAWASDLAGPDMLFSWGRQPEYFFGETGWLGPYLNLLPLGTIALFLIQQKLFSPPVTDEQTRAQQRMMTMMMVVIGVMFFKVPAGLCVYFVTSSIWAICERLLLKKITPPEELKPFDESAISGSHPTGRTKDKPVIEGTVPPQPSKRRARKA